MAALPRYRPCMRLEPSGSSPTRSDSAQPANLVAAPPPPRRRTAKPPSAKKPAGRKVADRQVAGQSGSGAAKPAKTAAKKRPAAVQTEPHRRAAKPAAAKAPGKKPALRRSAAAEKQRITQILDGLDALYPDAHCELDFRSPFELLVAVILSAQCTDDRVNMVTPELFRRYPDPPTLAASEPADVERIIYSTGFYRNKAKSIRLAAKKIVDKFGGQVPRTMAELLSLPGVARKTANVVLGTAYGIPSGVVVDTHVTRLSQRLSMTGHSDAVKIEKDLMARWPQERWIMGAHRLIWHGRRVCNARKPRCNECTLAPMCPSVELS